MPSVYKALAIRVLAGLVIAAGGILSPTSAEAGPPHRRPATGRHSPPRVNPTVA